MHYKSERTFLRVSLLALSQQKEEKLAPVKKNKYPIISIANFLREKCLHKAAVHVEPL